MISKVFETDKGGVINTGQETLCELHRQIYDILVLRLLESDPELFKAILGPLEKAYIAGIKMGQKLIENKMTIDDIFDAAPDDCSDIKRRRDERKRLTKLLGKNKEILSKLHEQL